MAVDVLTIAYYFNYDRHFQEVSSIVLAEPIDLAPKKRLIEAGAGEANGILELNRRTEV